MFSNAKVWLNMNIHWTSCDSANHSAPKAAIAYTKDKGTRAAQLIICVEWVVAGMLY